MAATIAVVTSTCIWFGLSAMACCVVALTVLGTSPKALASRLLGSLAPAAVVFLVLISFTANSTHSILGSAAPMDIGGRRMAGFASGVIDSFQYFGAALALRVDHQARSATRANHSATHLLHEALRQVLGDHVAQKGSLVSPDRLRFDIAHPKPITDAELAAVEDIANRVAERSDLAIGALAIGAALRRIAGKARQEIP